MMRDVTAFIVSIISLFIFCVPILLGTGIARGWNTSLTTGKFQFKTVEDPTRFWPEPNAYEENSDLDSELPGRSYSTASGTWYYWKYRPSDVAYCQPDEFDPITQPYVMSCNVPQSNAGTKAFVWSCYLLHQIIVWALIYKAQRLHKDDTKYHVNLRWYNITSLFVNGGFYILHLIQTHITYDATAQDVTEASSQASVIVLLVMVLVMEYKSRGLFLGWPASNDPATTCCCCCCGSCSWRLPSQPTELVRKYHGYAFAWATIYTLWYHPMESTAAHVTGFLHTGLLLIQQSLIFTPMHLNKYWRFVLETWVTIHGAVTAAQTQGTSFIGMFLFGFGWMIAFTQIHGLPYYLAFSDVAAATTATANHNDNNTMNVVDDIRGLTEISKTLKETNKNSISGDDDDDDERSKEKEQGEDNKDIDDEQKQHKSSSPPPMTSSSSSSSSYAYVKYIPTAKWKRWLVRLVPVVIYFGIVIASYQTWLNNDDQSLGVQMTEIIRIPAILYLLAVFVAIVGYGMLTASNKCCNCCCKKSNNEEEAPPSVSSSRGNDDDVEGKTDDHDATEDQTKKEEEVDQQQTTTTGKDETTTTMEEGTSTEERNGYGRVGPGTVLAVLAMMYAIMIVISVVVEAIHVEMDLITLMVILTSIFSVCALFVMIVMEKDMMRISLGPPQLPAPTTTSD